MRGCPLAGPCASSQGLPWLETWDARGDTEIQVNVTHHREGVDVVEVPGTRQWTARGLVELSGALR